MNFTHEPAFWDLDLRIEPARNPSPVDLMSLTIPTTSRNPTVCTDYCPSQEACRKYVPAR